MRENNRKPIEKCIKKLPQFTTMNVIDGQAGLVIYSSLIFYSLTIDNILNIIVLLILAGVSIAMLTGDNGILTQAQKAKKFINNSYVKSALCSGIQLDVMMKVINGKLDGKNNPYNVTEYNESRHANSPDVSGKNIADKVYNIFDLEEIYFEYVAEKSNDQYPFIGRGGLNVGIRPASYRYNNDGGESKDVSFRFVLYVL